MLFTIGVFNLVILQCVSEEKGRCDGPLKCCDGYKWTEKTNSCIECQYPFYGRSCGLICNCTEQGCSRFKGCKTEIPKIGLQTTGTSEPTGSTPGDLSTDSTLVAIIPTSKDYKKSTGIRTQHVGISTVFVNFTENNIDLHNPSDKKVQRAVLLRFIYTLSVITGVLFVAYLSLRVFDVAQSRRALRVSIQNNTTGNHYEEIELTTITNSGVP